MSSRVAAGLLELGPAAGGCCFFFFVLLVSSWLVQMPKGEKFLNAYILLNKRGHPRALKILWRHLAIMAIFKDEGRLRPRF